MDVKIVRSRHRAKTVSAREVEGYLLVQAPAGMSDAELQPIVDRLKKRLQNRRARESLDNQDLTRSGQMVGTFDYMAPEQMVGGQTSGQSDIYTLGIVIYEMVTGERPFGDPPTPAAMLTAMLSSAPPPMRNFVDVPDEVDALVMRCMDRDIAARYVDVVELSDEIDRILSQVDDATKTTVSRAPTGPTTTPVSVQVPPDMQPEDSLTWVDGAPQPPPSIVPSTFLPANPVTTLPGIVPPSPGTPWPLNAPKKRK